MEPHFSKNTNQEPTTTFSLQIVQFPECGSDRGIDIGIVNKGLDGGGDDGFGWEPYCNENKLGIPHKFAGNRAPSGAKRARIEVEPATNGGTIQFSVIWLDGNNRDFRCKSFEKLYNPFR